MLFMSVLSFLSMLIMGYFLRTLFPLLQGKRQQRQQHYLEIVSLLNNSLEKQACDYAAITASNDVYEAMKSALNEGQNNYDAAILLMRKELKLT